MRMEWAIGLAGLGAVGGLAVGLLIGLTLSAPGDATPRAAEVVSPPLPEQAVIYDGRRMTFAEANRLHEKVAAGLPKGWTLEPLQNPNEWVTYRGLRMTGAQFQEVVHCEQRLAAAESSAPAVMVAAPDFEEFQRKREQAELVRRAVRDELQLQELVLPAGAR